MTSLEQEQQAVLREYRKAMFFLSRWAAQRDAVAAAKAAPLASDCTLDAVNAAIRETETTPWLTLRTNTSRE